MENEEIKNEELENEEKKTNVESIDTYKNEIEELNDRNKRLLAEFENFKKRSDKEREKLYGIIIGDIITLMLPVMDNLDKAAEAKTEDINYKEGVVMVIKQFSDSLKNFGLEEIETVGKKFDPELHEAVNHIEDSNKGEKEIVEVYRKGYKLGTKVIRHAMVTVAN